jgi:two-component system chemotaxis sensor kinase CheA
MVPIGPLFTRFKRVVRDITRVNGKSVRLIISGEKTELDKRMIDELGDPLIHMVRNSVDHGIELPEERQAKGKPCEGTVTLDAFHRGNSIFIQVTDDGKGLDPDKILRKALEKGLVTEADAEKMSPHQIFQLIWEPGLSTAEKVTEVSGRGMGMDIVKSKIEDINGTVDLDSTPGQGTRLTIKLPLTLAILPSLMVEVESDIFALPMESVVEIVRVGRRDLTTIQGLWTARIRGRVISLVSLGEVFSWNRPTRPLSFDGETTLVVVGEAGQEIGLAVDRVLGEEDVVIKSMAENYQNVAGIAGASILGDGRVSLILDTSALIDLSSRQAVSS